MIRPAQPGEMEAVRGLFREYAEWVGSPICFESFAREVAELPGRYSPPQGALLLAFGQHDPHFLGQAILPAAGFQPAIGARRQRPRQQPEPGGAASSGAVSGARTGRDARRERNRQQPEPGGAANSGAVSGAPALAGCVALRRFSDGIAEMKRLYIRPAFQRGGLGRSLVERVIAEARAAGYRLLRLDTLPSMEPAIALYLSAGFREIPPYGDNPEEAICFEIPLG